MRHGSDDLRQMQSLPLEAKIRMTKMRIQTWYESWSRFEIINKETGATRFVTMDTRDQFAEPELKDGEFISSVRDGQVYVSFSGGKDSTVLKHIVDSMYDDVPSLFVNTGLEYPEIQKFAMSQPNVIAVRPEMRFDEVIKRYGYPVASKETAKRIYELRNHNLSDAYRDKLLNSESSWNRVADRWKPLIDAPFETSSKCCDVMKKRPAKKYGKETGRKPIVGTMASESLLRRAQWMKDGCNAFDGKTPRSAPMSFWTEQDVLEYIKRFNVPYCSVYGDIVNAEDGLKTTGCNRTGCTFCMFGCHQEKEPNRFQRLKETHPRQYEFCINGGEMVDGKWQPNKQGLGLGHVLDYIGVKYE